MEINSIKKYTIIIVFKSFMFDRKQKFEQTVTRIVHYQSNLYLKFGSVSALISKTTGTPSLRVTVVA